MNEAMPAAWTAVDTERWERSDGFFVRRRGSMTTIGHVERALTLYELRTLWRKLVRAEPWNEALARRVLREFGHDATTVLRIPELAPTLLEAARALDTTIHPPRPPAQIIAFDPERRGTSRDRPPATPRNPRAHSAHREPPEAT